MANHILAIETSNPSAWTPSSPVRPGVAVLTRGMDLLARADIDPDALTPRDALQRLYELKALAGGGTQADGQRGR